MRSEKNILTAFVLNFFFSAFEFAGGLYTGSVAIISDALHDFGDAVSIGISFYLERKSKIPPDENYTYGYMRYSVLGSVITTLILIMGSFAVIYNAVVRIFNPVEINSGGMIIFALVGVCVNLCAVFFTRDGESLNEKAVNLHMLEDVLGWVVVLIGAFVMKFANIKIVDPLMSVGVALFILVNAFSNLSHAISVLVEKKPPGIDIEKIKSDILTVGGVSGVHHIHIWSLDGNKNCGTMHVVANGDFYIIKEKIKMILTKHQIHHITIDLETEEESCLEKECSIYKEKQKCNGCHHHH